MHDDDDILKLHIQGANNFKTLCTMWKPMTLYFGICTLVSLECCTIVNGDTCELTKLKDDFFLSTVFFSMTVLAYIHLTCCRLFFFILLSFFHFGVTTVTFITRRSLISELFCMNNLLLQSSFLDADFVNFNKNGSNEEVNSNLKALPSTMVSKAGEWITGTIIVLL
jgi:hypothetical protein